MALTRIANIASTIPDDSIDNVKMANIVQSKNIIINGDMNVAQRSTSTASITSDGYYTLDRFTTEIGSFGTWTQSQASDAPTGQGFTKCLKMDCTTAQGSPGSSSVMLVGQSIEGQMLQHLCWGTSNAKQVTLSFWHKHTKTGTNIVELLESDNNDAVSGSYTQSVSDTWEKATIVFPAKTSGAVDNDNARSLRIRIIIGSGTDYTSGTLATTWQTSITNANRYAGQVNNADSTSNNFIITGVQLEAGDTASEFEFLPYGVNLRRCQRYYYLFCNTNNKEIGSGGYYNASQIFVSVPMIETMRSAPSLDFTSGTDYYICFRDGSNDAFNSFTLGQADINMVSLYNASEVSGTAGHAGFFRLNNASASMAFAAEL
jgi:hypothetical protein